MQAIHPERTGVEIVTVDIDCRAQQAGRRIAGRLGSREDRQEGEERRHKEVSAFPSSFYFCMH